MRYKLDILFDKSKKPYGGKLTYDSENRKSPYKNIENDLPKEYESANDEVPYIVEATDYVVKTIHKKDLISWKGGIELKFPISKKGALQVLEQFVSEKLQHFGDYQDVILGGKHSFLFHAAISPMLNIGLITPYHVIDAVSDYFDKLSPSSRKKLIHSVEGFIRQVIGWREFCRYTYEKNELFIDILGMKNKLSPKWYDKFGVEPVDMCIEKAFKYGYLHHTERLMVCANYMMYQDTDPVEMYKWFMEFALDSYDWVMEFNVYRMACYCAAYDETDPTDMTPYDSANPLNGMTLHNITKPYICGSRYLLKMSNIPRGVWCQMWDYMFWAFIDSHSKEIAKIYRLTPLVKFAKPKLIEMHEFAYVKNIR